jgi:CheY-like chemotaxis protein
MVRHAVLNILTEILHLARQGILQIVIRVHEAEVVWEILELEGSIADQDLQQLTGFMVGSALVRFYGGRFDLSREAQRSVFRFTLPITRPKTILIIEDDTDTINLYRRYLRRTGYAIQAARSQEQLDTLLADTRPDLILLDVLMPRLDGWMILQRLGTLPETARIPVVICSVLSQEHLALSLGAMQVLRKPVSSEALVKTVEELLVLPDRMG